MSHRFTTWWRALGVVLLSLAAVTWPTAARAATTNSFTLLHQSVLAPLSKKGSSHVTTTLRLSGPSATSATESLYAPLTTRVELNSLLEGVAPSTPALATTGSFALDCRRRGEVTFSVALDAAGVTTSPATCHGVHPRLALSCHAGACAGVYPLELSVTTGGETTSSWSMVVVRHAKVTTPLSLDFISRLDADALAHPRGTLDSLSAIGKLKTSPFTIAVNYQPLATITYGSTAAAWKAPLDAALASGEHQAIVSPPAAIDFAGLVANALPTQVAEQLALSAQLLHTLTGRDVNSPVVLNGRQTSASLLALSGAGVSNVVLTEGNFSPPPSTTTTWGEPFHVEGVATMSALSIDAPLSALVGNDTISPGRRAALTVGALAFLHNEDPNAAVVKTVVIESSLARTSKTFLTDLADSLHADPYSQLAPLTPSFKASLVGADAAPTVQSLAPYLAASTWSTRNVTTLETLIGAVTSYVESIHAPSVAAALHVAVARAEILGDPDQRQFAIDGANNLLNAQLAKFSIDASAITLAGQDTSLPITVMSHTGYRVNAVVHLVTNRLNFPKGANVRVTMTSPTESIRVPTADPLGSSLTLQVVLTTPNNQVVLARGALQVRIAGTSVVGYVVTIGSLVVLAVWWWRTIRRRPKGRHAK